jgi:hypothetical protein
MWSLFSSKFLIVQFNEGQEFWEISRSISKSSMEKVPVVGK